MLAQNGLNYFKKLIKRLDIILRKKLYIHKGIYPATDEPTKCFNVTDVPTMLTKDYLLGIRLRAIRRGVWYKALDRVERGIIDLTTRVVEKVESSVLGVELVKILSKLMNAMKSEFVKHLEEFGFNRAKEIAHQARVWGSVKMNWASDIGFAKYLTAMDMNNNTWFGF